MIFDLWPHPKVTSLTLGWKFYLHSVLLVIPVDLIYHMTMFEKKKFLTLWAPPAPQSPTPGAWPRGQNENPVWYFLYLSFVRTHTKFGIKIFESSVSLSLSHWYPGSGVVLDCIDSWSLHHYLLLVIEIKWYLTFWPLPRAPGGGAKKSLTLHAPFMSVTHTPNLVEFRPMV